MQTKPTILGRRKISRNLGEKSHSSFYDRFGKATCKKGRSLNPSSSPVTVMDLALWSLKICQLLIWSAAVLFTIFTLFSLFSKGRRLLATKSAFRMNQLAEIDIFSWPRITGSLWFFPLYSCTQSSRTLPLFFISAFGADKEGCFQASLCTDKHSCAFSLHNIRRSLVSD